MTITAAIDRLANHSVILELNLLKLDPMALKKAKLFASDDFAITQ